MQYSIHPASDKSAYKSQHYAYHNSKNTCKKGYCKYVLAACHNLQSQISAKVVRPQRMFKRRCVKLFARNRRFRKHRSDNCHHNEKQHHTKTYCGFFVAIDFFDSIAYCNKKLFQRFTYRGSTCFETVLLLRIIHALLLIRGSISEYIESATRFASTRIKLSNNSIPTIIK